jgi:hypothetical protein
VIHVAGRAHHDVLHEREGSRVICFSQQQIWDPKRLQNDVASSRGRAARNDQS